VLNGGRATGDGWCKVRGFVCKGTVQRQYDNERRGKELADVH
jgi:hypothetical protein